MSPHDYYTLLALSLAALALLVGPPVVQLFRLIDEGEKETEAARRRIAARKAAMPNLPAVEHGEPDLEDKP